MSRLNPPIQRLKEESAPARVRGSSRPALLIEMEHSRKREEETDRNGQSSSGCRLALGKATRCPLSAALDEKKVLLTL